MEVSMPANGEESSALDDGRGVGTRFLTWGECPFGRVHLVRLAPHGPAGGRVEAHHALVAGNPVQLKIRNEDLALRHHRAGEAEAHGRTPAYARQTGLGFSDEPGG